VLKQRVVTALLLVAVLLTVMLGLPPIATVWLLTALILLGAWEWAGFVGVAGLPTRATFTALIALALAASLYFLSTEPAFLRIVLLVALAWWFAAFLWVCFAPGRVNPGTAAVAGVLALVPCWLALVYATLADHGTRWVLFTLALVWAADTGAFFAGRWFGRVPLAPRVSPKKTWEGVIGGVILSGIVAWLAATYLFAVSVWPFVTTCVAVAGLSIVGDLTESMLKRAAGLKDSGSLFPGHGGVLDRIDSVTAAAPALVFALIGLKVIP
jgi:phosphatidate cytidylyltransferase